MKFGPTTQMRDNEVIAGYVLTHKNGSRTWLRGASQKIAFLAAAKAEKAESLEHCRAFVVRNGVSMPCA